jgi:glyoxylase-like metal-dependent hydrolase (beta-lactamase superfamily II)
MKRWPLLLIATTCLQLGAAAQSPTLDSYAKARPILDRAIAAYGGLPELRKIENVTFRLEGDTVHRNQSKKTFAFDRTPYKAEYIIDVKNTRYRQQQDGHYPGGFDWVNGFAINKAEGVTWDVLRGTFNPIPNVPPANFRGRLRMFPHFVVLNAAERSSRLRYLGTANIDGRAHSVVSYANEDGLEISLYIDDKTGLLSRHEFMMTDAFAGDALAQMTFTGYRQENGRWVPTGRIDHRSGELMNDLKFADVRFNAPVTDDNFKIPTGMKAATPAPTAQPVAKYSESVYTVNAGGYNVLVVGFKDHVFVMEAPIGDGVSRQAIAEIKKLFPGKPIKYVAVSHHHDDHAGGIRTYIAEGSTLIALPGEKAFFEKVAKSRFTIDPDALMLNPKPIKFELLKEGKRTLTDGTTTVELIDIGPGGHTDEMLVAYLPAEKLVFQGDLVNRPGNGDPATINDTTVHFANWLESSKLPVERIIGVHGPPSTLDELRKGVADRRGATLNK